MPPHVAVPAFHISRLSFSTRVLMTLFILSSAGGSVFVSTAVYHVRTGWTSGGAEEHFRGNEGLPPDQVKELKVRMPDEQLADVIHPHAYMIPLFLFTLGHMLSLCSLDERTKIALYVASFLGGAGVTFAPWLVRAAPGWGWALQASMFLFLASLVALSAIPLLQMWGIWRAGGRTTAPLDL